MAKLANQTNLTDESRKITSIDDVMEFQKILQILNRYYKQFNRDEEPSPSALFREKVGVASPEDLEVSLKKFGRYEFVVTAKILSSGETDSWIHIDGVQEERDSFARKNMMKHPVFSIVNLTDIYLRGE